MMIDAPVNIAHTIRTAMVGLISVVLAGISGACALPGILGGVAQQVQQGATSTGQTAGNTGSAIAKGATSLFDFGAALTTLKGGGKVAKPQLDANSALSSNLPFSFSAGTLTLGKGVQNAWLRPIGNALFVNADGNWFKQDSAFAIAGIGGLIGGAGAGYRVQVAPASLKVVGNDLPNFIGFDSEGLPARSLKIDIDGGAGNDALTVVDDGIGLATGSVLSGGEGEDAINAKTGGFTLAGGLGNDTIIGSDGEDTIDGGDGDDTVTAGPGNDRVDGGPGADTVEGGAGDDVLLGGAGDDKLMGEDGSDRVDGGIGNDTAEGGAGNDKLEGGDGDDTMLGGEGSDVLEGGIGNDTADGGPGNDKLEGGDGSDTMVGGAGNDILEGGGGDDSVQGGDGDDQLKGGDGSDTIGGGDGSDTVVSDGTVGKDSVDGGAGADTLYGVSTDELLTGGADSADVTKSEAEQAPVFTESDELRDLDT